METKQWLTLGIVLTMVFSLSLGTGFLVYAQHGHQGDRGQMMSDGYDGEHSNMGHHGDEMMGTMPMMHENMSGEEMNQFCDQMKERHQSMKKMRLKDQEELQELVETMKQASGDEKLEAIEETVLELVDQHQKRGKMMMKSKHSMMGSMMGMHRMDDEQRQRMMNKMQNCPMMKEMMGSDQGKGTPMRSPAEHHRK